MKTRRFVLVSCSGPDGSGKTTLARDAIELLAEHGVDARYHWMRLGSSRFLELVKKLAGGRAAGLSGEPGGYKEVLAQRSRLRRAWSWVLFADYLVRVWAKVLAARLRGGVHVVDRYAPDAAVDLAVVYGFEGAARLMRLTPSPHVRVLVTARGEDLASRGETPADPAFIERSLALYEGWEEHFTHRIDTGAGGAGPSRALADAIVAARGG